MEERYIASVDLGTSKVALTVAKITGEDVQILFYRERPSQGVRYSAVFNPSKAAAEIKACVEEAEKELHIKILQVVVGLPRCDVRQESNSAKVDRVNPDESITLEEIETLKSIAGNDYPLQNPDKEQIYGAIAQSFSTEDATQLIESDIIGMMPEQLEGNFKLFIGKRNAVKIIDKVFNELDIAIATKYFTPTTLPKAVLTNDEMDSGVALVDFGGGVTSVTIYSKHLLRYYAAIPFGGKSITSDIRSECTISEHLAENIKKAYGACQPDRLASLDEKIIQIEEEELGYKQIPVKYLSEVISARAKEIIDAILYHIEMSGLADELRSGIVITGGGAELANLTGFVKEISGLPVRKGLPRRLFSASDCPGIQDTSATNSIGMILAAKEDQGINCMEAPYETEDPQEEPIDTRAETDAYIETEVGFLENSWNGEYQHTETVPDLEGPAIPEDAEEGQTGQLFTDDETLDNDKPLKKKGRKGRQKENKPKKPNFLTLTWRKVTSSLYNSITDDEGENE